MNAFQMMLESYMDVAFDAFETWSLRNIFAIKPGMPVVAPHHKGLDLENKGEEEAELLTEVEDLRRRINNVRKSCCGCFGFILLYSTHLRVAHCSNDASNACMPERIGLLVSHCGARRADSDGWTTSSIHPPSPYSPPLQLKSWSSSTPCRRSRISTPR